MTKTSEIEGLLRKLEESGEWSESELQKVRDLIGDGPVTVMALTPDDVEELMGRDPGYMPEGTEGWMDEEAERRSYDKPRRDTHMPRWPDERKLPQEVELSLTPRPADVEAAKDATSQEVRIAQLEHAMTEVFARLKALEERVIDPSA